MSEKGDVRVRVPATISLRDVLYLGVAVVSITTTFMLYGTRLSILEEKILNIHSNIEEIKEDVKEIQKEDLYLHNDVEKKLDAMLDRLREHEGRLDRYEWMLGVDDAEG